MLPNCLFSTVVPNCPRCQSVLFLLWCQIVLFLLRCQIVLLYIAVPNCPGAKMSWCLNVLGAKVSSFTLRCQIVLVPNCLVLYCLGAKLTLLPNCLVPNCPVAKLYGAKFPWYRLWLARQIFSTLFFSLIFCIFIFESALEWSKITKYPPWTWYNCTKYVCPLLGYLGLCQVLLIRWAL